MRHLYLLLIALFAFSASSSAQQTHIVDLAGTGDFTTIHAAVTAAADGDTIRVNPDQYAFTADLGQINVDKELIIIGSGYMPVEEGGTELVDIAGDGYFSVGASADGTIIKGFRVQGGSNFISSESGANNLTIERNLLVDGSSAIYVRGSQDTVRHNICVGIAINCIATDGTNTQITNNIISEASVNAASRGAVAVGSGGDGVVVAYNLFINVNHTFSSGASLITAGPAEIYSNGFTGNTRSIRVSFGTPFITNNAFYNSGQSQGLNIVEAAPSFVNFDPDNDVFDLNFIDNNDFNLNLADNSAWVDEGRTGTLYLDTDGSRSDIGIYAGPNPFVGGQGAPTVPVVFDLQVSPTTVSPSGTITITATGRIGSDGN